ncbi:MAG: N-acetyltransferase [Candidatus Rokubacteria bacterium]|nr:N-acetyltransferase [Candidatus Rokubacteria bacterium]
MIRLATEQDAEAVQAIYAPIVARTAISFEVDPPSVAEMRDRIRTTLERFPWLVYEHEGRVVGYVYAGPHRARQAYQCKYSRGQGYCRAYAGITLPNAGSVGLHEAVGFRPVGVYRGVGFKLDTWHDVGWWERELQPLRPSPPPPSPGFRGMIGGTLTEARNDP